MIDSTLSKSNLIHLDDESLFIDGTTKFLLI